MKSCPECSAEVRDAARLCRYCGHLFRSEAPDTFARSPEGSAETGGAGSRFAAFLRASPWRAAAIGLLALLVLAVGLAIGAASDEDSTRPNALALSLERNFSTELRRVSNNLRPALTERGIGEAYQVKGGSSTCEEERGSFLHCRVWLVNSEGTEFVLVYALAPTGGGCWKATPQRAELADGRRIPLDPAEVPVLDTCLPSERAGGSRRPGGQTTETGSACDPAYPDFCIATPPPDLDCQDFSQTDFTVDRNEGDPHLLDSNADGVGCEQDQAPTTATAAEGPAGVLGTSSVGTVSVGTPSEEVERVFGRPVRKEEVNYGLGPAPQIDWIWEFDDGEFRLQFETERGTVTGYVSETARFKTRSGVGVGDPFSLIQDRYGDQLAEAPIGDGGYMLSEGEPGTHPALTFAVEGETIAAISGGESQAAGE